MLDQLQRDIRHRLDEVLDEADRLRQALVAIGSPEHPTSLAASPGARDTGPAAVEAGRAAPGATKRAVLAALGGGTAMTASDVAKATGLGRATVSTTLSKLARAGEVTKAARGYELVD